MASYPPPPFPPDPRQQRRYLKDMGRAQKDAARSYMRQEIYRRKLLREQQRVYRRSSILGPVIVLAAGVVLLLIGLGRLPMNVFADWYGKWWPVFLVAAGVILMAEWAFDQRTPVDGVPVRRGIGGGAIFLLILLAIAGPIVRGVRGGHDIMVNAFDLNGDNFDRLFGEKHDVEQQIDQAFPAGSSLAIDNPHGDVTIVGKSGDDRVHIVVDKQLYVRSDSEADASARRLSPTVAMVGATLSISVPTLDGASADLSITVPDFAETTVTTNHGAVNISDLHAPVNVTTNHGDIQVNGITGAVNAHINSSGSSFAAHNITGQVSVKGRGQDLNVTDIAGNVAIDGEFFGDTHFERLRAPVTFRSHRTQLSLMRVDGDVDFSSNSELSGRDLTGPVMLHTSSRNISFERVAGDMDIANSNGSVDLTSLSPLGNVTVANRNGTVNLTVPENSGFNLDADTHDGTVLNDFGLHSFEDHNHQADVHDRVGNGAVHVSLQTTHADIDIRKGAFAAIATPASPAAPAKPETPAKPAKPTKAASKDF